MDQKQAESYLFNEFLHFVAVAIEASGVAIIAVGGAITLLLFLLKGFRLNQWLCLLDEFRTSFAKAILLGLEFLVAADIVGTITVKPDVNSLYSLGLIVLIRTFLSFSLNVEIEGKLPWKRFEKK